MFVGLKRFSMIWTRVLRSTPGKRLSTESTMLLALSPSTATGVWVGYNIPRGLGCNSGRVWRLAALSSASWPSSSAIRVSVGSAGASWILGGRWFEGSGFEEVVVGRGSCWVRSWRTTLSTISCSWERRSSLIVVRLIDLSEAEADGGRVAGSLVAT